MSAEGQTATGDFERESLVRRPSTRGCSEQYSLAKVLGAGQPRPSVRTAA